MRDRSALAAAFILAALLGLFFFDVVFLGKTLKVSRTIATVYPTGPADAPGPPPQTIPITDNTPGVLEEPYLAFKQQVFAERSLPLWNPHQAAGFPFAANPEGTPFFLPDLPLYLLPERYAWDVFLLLRLFAAGFFTYAFLRSVGCVQAAAIGGGAAYMLSGPLITWLNNVTMNPDCLLPLLLFALEHVRRAERRWAMPLAAITIGLILLGGHPEHAFFVQLVGIAFLGFRVATADDTPAIRPTLRRIATAYLLGVGLAAVFVFPFIEFLQLGWSYHGPDAGLETDEARGRAITILMPYLFQPELVTPTYQHAGWLGGYLGAATVLLALLGVRRASPGRLGLFFGVVLALALGKIYAVPGLNLVGALPVLRFVRFSLHLPATVGFAAAVLVGFALDAVGRGTADPRRTAAFAASLGAVALGFVVYNLPALDWGRTVRAALPVGLVLGTVAAVVWLVHRRRLATRHAVVLLVAVLAGELRLYQPTAHPDRYAAFAEAPYVRWLRATPDRGRVFGTEWTLFPNTASAFALDDLGIYGGLFVGRFVRFVRTLIDPRRFSVGSHVGELRAQLPDYASPFLDLLSVRYLVAPPGVPEPPGTTLVYDADVRIFRRDQALPRAYTVTHWTVVADEAEAIAALQHGYDFRSSVLLETSAAALPSPSAPAPAVPARLVHYHTNRVEIVAETTGPAVLVLADTYYPGWRAIVDGRPAPVLAANGIVRAVALPGPGSHVVEMRFRPTTVLAGAVVSLASIAIIGLAFGGLAFGAPIARHLSRSGPKDAPAASPRRASALRSRAD
jgi:hypothetical protein